MTDQNEDTPNTPPDTFLADITAAQEDLARANKILNETDHTEELNMELEKHIETLRAIFSKEVADDLPLPEPPIPVAFLIPAIEQLMDEGVFRATEDDSPHTHFLTRLLKQASDTQGVHDFHIRVSKACGHIGRNLPSPLSLTMEGDCGEWTGYSMQGGTLTVKGNCGTYTGLAMKGGTLTVERNCGELTGSWMEGGILIVEGNCGKGTGYHMEGGTLVINGEVEGWTPDEDSPFRQENTGTIIHKGIILWNNGPTPDTPQQ